MSDEYEPSMFDRPHCPFGHGQLSSVINEREVLRCAECEYEFGCYK